MTTSSSGSLLLLNKLWEILSWKSQPHHTLWSYPQSYPSHGKYWDRKYPLVISNVGSHICKMRPCVHFVCSCWADISTARPKIASPQYIQDIFLGQCSTNSCRSPSVIFVRTPPPKQRLSSCVFCKFYLCLTPCLHCSACTLSFLSSVFNLGGWGRFNVRPSLTHCC